MNYEQVRNVGIVAFALIIAISVVSCGKKADEDQAATVGTAQQAGITADRVASNTVEAAKQTAAEVKEASDAAVIKTGEILEKAGEEIEKTGENLQK